MKVKYVGESDFPYFTKGNVYDVIAVETGPDFNAGKGETNWYRIVTDMEEDYLFLPEDFESVDDTEDGMEKID